MTKSQSIFAHYRRLCRPVLLAPWLGLPVEEDRYLCPEFGSRLSAELLEDFLEVDLVAAGIAVSSSDGVIIKSSFVGDENCLVVPRASNENCSWEMVQSVGRWIGNAPVATERLLLTTADISEVTILRNLGISVIATSGLSERAMWDLLREAASGDFRGESTSAPPSFEPRGEQSLSEAENAQLCGVPTVGANHIAADVDAGTVTSDTERLIPISTSADVGVLIIVGWSVTSLSAERPRALNALLQGLIDSERFLRWDISPIGVWIPSSEELEGFRFCLGRGDFQALRRQFEESLLASSFLPEHALRDPHAPLPTPTYLQAQCDYDRIARGKIRGFGFATVDAAAETLRLAIEQDFIAPLIEAGVDAADAVERNRLMLAAALAKRFHFAEIRGPGESPVSIPELTRLANAFRALTARGSR